MKAQLKKAGFKIGFSKTRQWWWVHPRGEHYGCGDSYPSLEFMFNELKTQYTELNIEMNK